MIQFSKIEEAIEDFKQGKFVIVVDDEDRENEGDFITPAEMITPEKACSVLPSPSHVPRSWNCLIRWRKTRPCWAHPSR